MVEYMEREFGERALNGDKAQRAILQEKVAELERMLEQQRAMDNSTADSKPRSDVGSEHETDSDVSALLPRAGERRKDLPNCRSTDAKRACVSRLIQMSRANEPAFVRACRMRMTTWTVCRYQPRRRT